MSRGTWSVGAASLMLAATVVVSADGKQKAFESTWVGRRVIVRRPLYSLVYKERGRLGSVTAKRDGLTVTTPFAGTYFQFDGRRDVDDVTEHDVLRIVNSVKAAYIKDGLLDEGAVQVIEPVMLARYDPGTELVVRAARVKLEAVRLDFSLAADGDKDVATSLTVQWPAPLSKSFSERVDVEGLIRQYLTLQE